mgnify:CR=1 FL=1
MDLTPDQIRRHLARLFRQLAQDIEAGDTTIPPLSRYGFDGFWPCGVIDLQTGDYVYSLVYVATTLDEAERDDRMNRLLDDLSGHTR